MTKIRLGLLGSQGKMGTLVREKLKKLPQTNEGEIQLVYEPKRGDGCLSLPESKKGAEEVILDYSSPDFLLETIRFFQQKGRKTRWLVGSTGWTNDQLTLLEAYKDTQLILRAPNFSLGVLILQKALRSIEKDLKLANFNVAMKEIHHTRKKDAPSGTALLLKEVLPSFGNFPIESVREGDVVGFHEVTFETSQEKVTFSHDAKDRGVFAEGALFCVKQFALWPLEKSGRIHTLEGLF
jgi:4-hydroxy-tetrahydrodipicolinate reductase